ncbi:indole-3-glycerol phosphate synthase TrpC [Liquorilactobacillus mali]|uniref:Indole-3-glycerol phosphate synthase n=1 Tax=Liquorilactobacillus mali KCTC 3596 = DSM 20444 TaxID=1046596 RepID=J0UUF5_9LACO|nr:indole-3-glycerol phosphate synthase TrpC [Liquorilactobacillus mali]EJF01537.1 indole-3-glycerol-phosphate synthase [Liquorilactobacillus mali KCTC 3596 = DSM 20444]KRN10618.1 indole-3-glycerol-phosphate synthase [Liquorilactobacillus mali KCTC 3596 = DSM 20444]MDC7952916.1 indole-3-glycerol phosphate synthase TrpC [Liquorilactobacillus mali]MDV7758582.1 indole-3-glycerol phosphate synthase TrpC [Liquorilactobacillus mali]QFQ75350.1 indole-3-glycerol phosphate synthase TrpC [Liquorilactoba
MILDDLVAATSERLELCKQKVTFEELKLLSRQSKSKGLAESFKQNLRTNELSVIAEVKQASPSKGVIVNEFPYLEIAKEYQAAGVSAISVLTEEKYFHGKLEYLKEIAQKSELPILRKDFVIDPYMIYEARVAGATLVLLIVAILSDEQLNEYLELAHDLGMEAIVEVHNHHELTRALNTDAAIIGINNRDLTNFKVSLETTCKLSALVPANRLVISESGIQSGKDITYLQDNARINGVLVGEYLMRAENKKDTILKMKG